MNLPVQLEAPVRVSASVRRKALVLLKALARLKPATDIRRSRLPQPSLASRPQPHRTALYIRDRPREPALIDRAATQASTRVEEKGRPSSPRGGQRRPRPPWARRQSATWQNALPDVIKWVQIGHFESEEPAQTVSND